MKKLICILTMMIMLINNYQALGAMTIMSETITPVGWQYLDKIQYINQYTNAEYVLNNSKLNWVKFSIPNKPDYKVPSGEVWVRVKLPQGNYRDPSIFFMTYDQIFEIYLDKKRIYNFGSFGEKAKHKSPGSPWHIISLPDNYGDKYIYLKMYSVRSANHGLIKKFELGSYKTHLTHLIKTGTVQFVLANIYVFVGLFALFFLFMRRAGRKPLLYLCFATVLTGTWLVSEGTMKQFFIYSPKLWVYVDIISQYSIPIFYGLFINELFQNQYRKLQLGFVYIHTFILCSALLADILEILPLVATLNGFYVCFGVNLLSMIVIISKSFRKWSTDLKIFSCGFSAICLSGILDLLNSTDRNHNNIIFTEIGIFIFVFSLAILLLYNMIKTQDNMHKYIDELNSKEAMLIEKNKQLDEAIINDKLKTEFFANLSHELKTPLNIISSTIQLLNKYSEENLITSTEKDLDRYLYIMKQNSYRLIRLVNNLIDITKIDTGYLSANMKKNDVVAVVEDITQSVADYIKRNGISITFDTDVEEKTIACDPDLIERIMLNLLSNAVKFSNPGASILVDVKDQGDEVEVIVKDTGIGLAPDKLDVIFERFVQVDKSLTRNHEGSGIGLSLVKSLVELHGGRISVESEYGKGSTFRIILPAVNEESEEKGYNESEIQAIHVEKVKIEFSDIYS